MRHESTICGSEKVDKCVLGDGGLEQRPARLSPSRRWLLWTPTTTAWSFSTASERRSAKAAPSPLHQGPAQGATLLLALLLLALAAGPACGHRGDSYPQDRPDPASAVDLETCRPCHASASPVAPWDALAVYPDIPIEALRRGSGEGLKRGFADLLPIDSTALEFAEWQRIIPQEDEGHGRTCLTCHLQQERRNPAPALAAPPGVLASAVASPDLVSMHAWLDTPPKTARENTMGLWVDVDTYRSMLVATVKILNYGAGHRSPSGAAGRNIVLEVGAEDGWGQPLQFVRGPTLPDFAGADQAGKPGIIYARVLADASGQIVAAPGDATRVLLDTRLQAGEHDEIAFAFMLPEDAPEGSPAWSVDTRLVLREALGQGQGEVMERATAVQGKAQ